MLNFFFVFFTCAIIYSGFVTILFGYRVESVYDFGASISQCLKFLITEDDSGAFLQFRSIRPQPHNMAARIARRKLAWADFRQLRQGCSSNGVFSLLILFCLAFLQPVVFARSPALGMQAINSPKHISCPEATLLLRVEYFSRLHAIPDAKSHLLFSCAQGCWAM